MILKLEMKKWTTTNASKERTGVTTYDVIHNNNHSQQLFEIGELNVSDAFLLTPDFFKGVTFCRRFQNMVEIAITF